MDNLKMYYIKDDYIDYLKNFDRNVPFNKEQSRPYIGVLFEQNNRFYFAPLASPKQKHKTMKNNIDIFKIHSGELGLINLNNMIPVSMENVLMINVKQQPITYRYLLYKQIRYINKNKHVLLKKAKKLYKLYYNNSLPKYVLSRCCDFKLLEEKCLEYEQYILNADKKQTLDDNKGSVIDKLKNIKKGRLPNTKNNDISL